MQGDAETILGPYVIEREIGRGGMGVIYKGRDERLGRAVAIKSLPEHFADDPGRLARFELEARALAQLNHPNIAGIYGVENLNGRKYLVLEFVEGETLADRLEAGPIPVDDAIEIADAIAAGIEAAHEAGVVHRDLKPDNIKITPDGNVKILDFGLAKSTKLSATGIDHDSPTLTTPHSPTIPGAILGTAPYMSPEQARGKIVDKRTDIWSFGVVLYEMLTGMRPFDGETATDAIAAILHKEIDFDRLPANTPIGVRRALKRCLERNRDLRMRDIGDVRLELRDRSDQSANQQQRATQSRRLTAALATLVIAAIAFIAVREFDRPAPVNAPRAVARLTLSIPWPRDAVKHFAISPSGDTFAFFVEEQSEQAEDAPPVNVLYLRELESDELRKVYSTAMSAEVVWFSPDERDLVMWQADEARREHCYRMSVEGGQPVRLLSANPLTYHSGSEACWLNHREFVVIRDDYALCAISIDDGSVRKLVNIPKETGLELWDMAIVPGQDYLLCTAQRGGDIFPRLVTIDLKSGETEELLADAFWAHYIEPGILLTRDLNTIVARTFDPKTRKLGERAVSLQPDFGAGVLSVSGTLAYFPARDINATIATIDREGRIAPLLSEEARYTELAAVSPDGRFVAVPKAEESLDFYTMLVMDIEGGAARRIDSGLCFYPRWLADGRLNYWRLTPNEKAELMICDPQSSAAPTVIREDLHPYYDWVTFTPDSRFMLYTRAESLEQPETCDIYLLDLAEADSAARPYMATENYEGEAAVSPDGKWIAFTGARGDVPYVFLSPFDSDSPPKPVRVAEFASMAPFWSADSKFLFFHRDSSYDVMEVALETEGELRFNQPRRIIDGLDIDQGYVAAMPDGERFMFIDKPAVSERFAVVLNWTDEVKRHFASANK